MNSSFDKSIEAITSQDDVITPHLLAEESLTILTPASLQSFALASLVINMLAPSTINGELGLPLASRKFCQLSALIVFGLPPEEKIMIRMMLKVKMNE
jgi:hypothetical protein